MDIENTINEAQKILSENSEWMKQYSEYAEALLKNISIIRSNRSKFNEFPPLLFYISTTKATTAKKRLLLDIRYRGQNVATLKADSNNITISTKNYNIKNLSNFKCTIELHDNQWQDAETTAFRKYFKYRPDFRHDNSKRNEEHNVESLLLTEFSKRKIVNKEITGIQPVKIGGIRFGMPTPISASDHKKPLKYSGSKGGGIDIFARTGKGRATYLTVIEVKDENNSKEPPKDALKQAIQYAVFIRELLRSKCGKDWYKVFGFSGKIPKTLIIRAVCAMPEDILDKSFAKQIFPIGYDKIECHYIYFKYDGKQLTNFQTSL